jgi:acetyl-CoA C-acetyltransferase
VVGAARHPLRVHDGGHRRELRREVRHQREEQDEYAIRSQQLADKAWKEGRLKDEVVPVEIKSRKGVELFAQDDHMRPDSTMEGSRSCRRPSARTAA